MSGLILVGQPMGEKELQVVQFIAVGYITWTIWLRLTETLACQPAYLYFI